MRRLSGLDAAVARSVTQRFDDRAEVRLRSQAAHRIERAVHSVRARVDRREHARRGDAAGVMRVEMDRQAGLFLQRLDQRKRCARLAQPGHVLDAQDVRASALQVARERHVVLEVVLRLARIGEIAGVADRRLAQLARLAHGVDCDAHVLDPVERVEDAEQVDARARRLIDEVAHDVVGIVGVADRIRRAQQHLQQQVRHGGAQLVQALPRTFVEEAHRDVERRAAPAFDREQVRRQARVVRRNRRQIVRAETRGQQRLMRVAHRRIRQQHALLLEHPGGETLGAQLVEQLLRARRRRRQLELRQLRVRQPRRARPAFHFIVAVDDDLADEVQQPRRAVALAREAEQLGRLVDELGRVVRAREARMHDQLVEEAQVGRDAANAELPERAMHAHDRVLRGLRPRGHLHEQRIVRRRDDRAGVRRAGIEPDAEAGRAAIRRDAAVVGDEIVFRIFRRHAALHRVAVEADVLLARHAALGAADGRAFGDADLRAHDVDAGDRFGHRVLDLHTRIHFDEIELAAVCVLQEFHRARVEVAHGAADLQRLFAQLAPLLFVEERRRRALDHLLIAPLHSAVPLEQVHEVAVDVAEQLHFDVPRAHHELFEVHLVVAERCLGFAPCGGDFFRELCFAGNDAHTAPAAAPARLQHHRIADLGCEPRSRSIVVRQRRRRRHHRHAGRNRQLARAHLVAEPTHDLRRRTDEDHARRGAGFGELRVLGEKAVTGMDGVDVRGLRDADDVGDIQVGIDGRSTCADQVALVRLHPVQREAVFLGVDRDRADAELGRGAHHADGDLAAVRDQETADTLGHGRSITKGTFRISSAPIAIRDGLIEMRNVPVTPGWLHRAAAATAGPCGRSRCSAARIPCP